MLRTSHSAKTPEASAQTSVNGEVPGLSGGFRVIGRFSGLKATLTTAKLWLMRALRQLPR